MWCKLVRAALVAGVLCVFASAGPPTASGQVLELRRGRTHLRFEFEPRFAPFALPPPPVYAYGQAGPQFFSQPPGVVPYGGCNGGTAGYSLPYRYAPPAVYGAPGGPAYNGNGGSPAGYSNGGAFVRGGY